LTILKPVAAQNDSWVGVWFNPKPPHRSCGQNSFRRAESGNFAPRLAGSVPAGNARFAMQDVVMLLFTAVFFVLAFLYVKACQKLR
jgi:hypothetical protein